ncbi:nitrate/nitrite two-component system sensor histidine kinase NarQ [Candidatus Pantoea floridensis]|uniref:Sensor protein n=1 Tax=Candidatus Pantoea floridensis TaxID=1938870 RepID=A0A286BWS1_9GAMM|nr:nitrate/nitrite two-component system sensor histidine kinase NarQ [Pantoea floridensis]PIF21063.1 two-component system nitrate/nitrite sensor histidine kinase NarQ [Enterobacteriaceae bacterium JKS000233]SOD38579.1 two-component system, NarL family, nitrate/nitrite sensor histidine kinase NarQ [Pantoea floridensis]
MIVKRPVTRTIARALGMIVLLSLLTSGLALMTLSSSLRDAEAVNVAGSLRMQIYRLAWDSARDPQQLAHHMALYQQTLESPALQHLERPWVPLEVSSRYRYLRDSWPMLQQTLQPERAQVYQQHVAGYVSEIDRFVLAVQHYAELKMHLVAASSLFGFLAIVALALSTIRFIRRNVVRPLNTLVTASHSVEQANFTFPALPVEQPNELGVLAQAFTTMAERLHSHYRLLECAVREKTEDLTQANRTLSLLYESSQILTSSPPNPELFQGLLRLVQRREALTVLQITSEGIEFQAGVAADDLSWQRLALMQEDQTLGELRWQTRRAPPADELMQSLANMLARALWIWQTQKQYQQMLLIEERATIARELHDSLAQSLSFLRIQLALLRRNVDGTQPQAQAIIADFDRALSEAYQQLRELLTTFRLTIEQADLVQAMQAMIAPLQEQSQAVIEFDYQPGLQMLDAQQQVHVLQIAREALLNAIRHAQAQNIHIRYQRVADEDHLLTIDDDGCGIPSLEEPPGHYGLTIMAERAARLSGTLSITPQTQGTRVTLRFPPRPAHRLS